MAAHRLFSAILEATQKDKRMMFWLIVAVIALKIVVPLGTRPYRNFILAVLGTVVLIVGPTLIEVVIGGKGVALTWLALIYSPAIIVVLLIIYKLIEMIGDKIGWGRE